MARTRGGSDGPARQGSTADGTARRVRPDPPSPDLHRDRPSRHASGLAGASVFRGIEGYGRSNHIHTARLLSLSEDLPVSIVIVDAADRVRAFLPELEELVAGLVAVTVGWAAGTAIGALVI